MTAKGDGGTRGPTRSGIYRDRGPACNEAPERVRLRTYRVAWDATIDRVAVKHPGLKGMVIRDFRSTFTTHLREAGMDAALTAKLQGHSERMGDHYLQVTNDAASRAVLSLGASYDPGAVVRPTGEQPSAQTGS